MLLQVAAILIILHLSATFVVRYLRRGALNPWSSMMSDYLTGKYGELYCTTFYLLSVALGLIGDAWGGIAYILLTIGAIGVLGTAASRQFFLENSASNTVHKVSAAAAFIFTSAAELTHLWVTVAFPFAAAPLVFAFLFNRTQAKADGFEETGAYLLIMLCFLVVTL